MNAIPGVSPEDSLRDLVNESETELGGKSENTGDGVFSKAREIPVSTTGESGEPVPVIGDLSDLGGPRTSDSEKNEAATTEDASESYMLSSGEADPKSAVDSVMKMSMSDAVEEMEDLADKISDESSRKSEQPPMEDISIVAGLQIPEGNFPDSGESGSNTGSISGGG